MHTPPDPCSISRLICERPAQEFHLIKIWHIVSDMRIQRIDLTFGLPGCKGPSLKQWERFRTRSQVRNGAPDALLSVSYRHDSTFTKGSNVIYLPKALYTIQKSGRLASERGSHGVSTLSRKNKKLIMKLKHHTSSPARRSFASAQDRLHRLLAATVPKIFHALRLSQ